MDGSKCLESHSFKSNINASFWHKFTQLKLDVDKLDENERVIWGYFTNFNVSVGPLLEVDSTSFNSHCIVQNTHSLMTGKLFNKNTIETFKECNKTVIINEEGKKLWEDIETGKCLMKPNLLNRFFVLSFADLKKYHYYYWFAFPTPVAINLCLNSIESLNQDWDQLAQNYLTSLDGDQRAFFLIETKSKTLLPLSSLIHSIKNDEIEKKYYFAFTDASSNGETPSSNIRNYAVLLLHHCLTLHGKSINFLSLRLNRTDGELTAKNSLILNVTLPSLTENLKDVILDGFIGWERNERGKLGPRMVNMKNSIDPICLAETSVDLNLKLMKWRVQPDIDLEKIKNTKCLLLGSGTLGCAVARVLLGWGVRSINFVDNSTVSYSNPVRQSLFTFEDCKNSAPKAEAAAANLKKIFPGVKSQGYQFNIPMPGHPVGESVLDQTKRNVNELEKLIKDSDIIFLLMDSRESRWLPTLLSAHYEKIVINAALGFDTYLVMRHGMRTEKLIEHQTREGLKMIGGNELGCYFCNDVTAPGNSTKDRTLDQQCTVTRPGVSQIAGALAVELAISIVQHKLGGFAPAYYTTSKAGPLNSDNLEDGFLGILPHSIRGFLSQFEQILPATEKYSQCIACSTFVLDEYKRKGIEFLLNVFETSKYLETLTGLEKMQLEVEDELEKWDMSDFESE